MGDEAKMTWLKGLITVIIGIAAIFGGYFMLQEVYSKCQDVGQPPVEYGLPPETNLLTCTMSSPIYILFSVGGTSCIGGGMWALIDGLKAFFTGLVGDKK